MSPPWAPFPASVMRVTLFRHDDLRTVYIPDYGYCRAVGHVTIPDVPTHLVELGIVYSGTAPNETLDVLLFGQNAFAGVEYSSRRYDVYRRSDELLSPGHEGITNPWFVGMVLPLEGGAAELECFVYVSTHSGARPASPGSQQLILR